MKKPPQQADTAKAARIPDLMRLAQAEGLLAAYRAWKRGESREEVLEEVASQAERAAVLRLQAKFTRGPDNGVDP